MLMPIPDGIRPVGTDPSRKRLGPAQSLVGHVMHHMESIGWQVGPVPSGNSGGIRAATEERSTLLAARFGGHTHVGILATLLWIWCAGEISSGATTPPKRGEYRVVDLGTLGGPRSEARDINNRGLVAGFAQATTYESHAVVWSYNFASSNHLVHSLGLGEGHGISGGGTVAGLSPAGGTVWGSGEPVLLGSNKWASGISGGGLAVGWMPVLVTNQVITNWVMVADHAVSFSGATATDLAQRPEWICRAYGVSDGGLIVGFVNTNRFTPDRPVHAWIFPERDLHTLSSLSNSVALAANNAGQVVGYANNNPTGPFNQPMFWSQATGMRLLKTLGDIYGSALGLNNRGQAVGVIRSSAVLWSNLGETNETLIYLNDLLVSGTGWWLQAGYAINDRGEIVGYGRPPNSGEVHAFLFVPTNIVPRHIEGSVIAFGRDFLGETTRHILQEVQVELLMAEGGELTPLETTHTDANGAFSFDVREEASAQFALKVSLRDRTGWLEVYHHNDNPSEVAWLRTPAFTAADNTRAEITFHINEDVSDTRVNNECTYRLNGQQFHVPGLGTPPDATPRGDAGVDTTAFAHLVVIYRNTRLGARFANEHLGLTPSLVRVRAFAVGTGTGWSRPASPGEPATIWIDSTDSHYNPFFFGTRVHGADRPSNREFHEYGHHIMFISPIAGVNALPRGDGTNHAGLRNPTSADSWVEGFATFISTVISHRMLDRSESPRPEVYHVAGSRFSLERNFYLDHPLIYGPQSGQPEEYVVASLLWDMYDPTTNEWMVTQWMFDSVQLDWPVFWAVISAPGVTNVYELYRALMDFATRNLSALDRSELQSRFPWAGIYDDRTAGTAWFEIGNGLHDLSETIGVTSWNINALHRPQLSPLPAAYIRLSVMDSAGTALEGAVLEVRTVSPPPLDAEDIAYALPLTVAGPCEIPVIAPPPPAKVVLRVRKDGFVDSPELEIDAEWFWAQQVETNASGVLMEHTFALAASAADLAAQATVQPGVAPVGAILAYTITLTNAGPAEATDVRVTNTFSGPVTLGAVMASQGSCSQTGTVVTCDLGTLGLGSGATLTIQVVPTASGVVSHAGSVFANESDPSPANNLVSTRAAIVPVPGLSLKPGTDGSGLEVAWPASEAAFVLEYAESLTPPALWRPVEITPTRLGEQFRVTVPVPANTVFFRLRHP